MARPLNRRRVDWVDELSRLFEKIDDASPKARKTLRKTVDSFLQESSPADLRRFARRLAGLT
jgi:hypothetical protein